MPDKETFIRPEELWRTLGLRANQTVVHLGCGAGFYLIPAAQIVGSKGKVIGADVREDMLQEVESRAEREKVADIIQTVRVNLEDHNNEGIPAGKADWTLVANILYQADPKKILGEAVRVTKPQGTVVVVEWDIAATPLGPPPEKRRSPAEITAEAAAAGLKPTGTFSPSPYHFGLLFKKVA
jgi:ubiquinone/menaquinone biosynthesis C-methylase UbiE